MKRNDPHSWMISLCGNRSADCLQRRFHGTFDAALAKADELECEAGFQVLGVHIIRCTA